MINKTIVASASSPIKSAIKIIRISGDQAFEIVNNVSSTQIEKNQKRLFRTRIVNENQIIDDVLVLAFVAPNSFTGEDVIEIHCHGSQLIVNKIIIALIAHGAEMAARGEFTKRAFLNGKLDLTQAESINDIINSQNELSLKISQNTLYGKTKELIDNLKTDLLSVIANVEVNIDYPEYDDVENLKNNTLLPKINTLITKMRKIIKNSTIVKTIKDGIDTAIIGQPNVGKSTLLNALINEEKAITSSIPGTTRDIVEGKIEIAGIRLNLIDTAGIRDTNEIIEQKGILKTKEIIDKADLIILIINQELSENDQKLIELCKGKKLFIVNNKADIKINPGYINVSALNKEIEELIEKINQEFYSSDFDIKDNYLNNSRQIGLMKKSLNSLRSARNTLENGYEIDMCATDLQDCYVYLKEIVGERAKINLLDELFSKFCLGK